MNRKKIIIICSILIITILATTTFYTFSNKDEIQNSTETTSVNNFRDYTAIKTSLDNNTVAYIPLDDRPINIDRVKYLAQSIGYNLQLPNVDDYKTYLD